MPSNIQPLKPDGLKQSPLNPVEIPLQQPKKFDETEFQINDRVGWIDLIRLWVKENLINDILNSLKPNSGVYMSKAWYTSKTLWVNLIVFVWQFIGPLVGIPTVSPELLVGILAVINFILRIITKTEVTIS